MAVTYVHFLIPIIGAFLFLLIGCCYGRKLKNLIHIPKVAIMGNALAEQYERGQRRGSGYLEEDDDHGYVGIDIPIRFLYRSVPKGNVVTLFESGDLCNSVGLNQSDSGIISLTEQNDRDISNQDSSSTESIPMQMVIPVDVEPNVLVEENQTVNTLHPMEGVNS